MKQLLPLVVGFILTSVVGGALGYYFQTRSWNHQYEMQLREQERERAARAFEEISRLMDKRLYRLRQLYWCLSGDEAQGGGGKDADRKMDDYREVLYEWNDSINRNLALLHQYFGVAMRDRLDYEVGAEFVELGRQVERLWGHPLGSQEQASHAALGQRIGSLRSRIYDFNIDMIGLLQSGSVGWFMLEVRRSLPGSGHASRGRP